MNWIKRNAGLVGIVSVGLLATAVCSYFVATASSKASEASATLKSDADRLTRLLNAKPAPTKENAGLLDTQAAALEDLAGKLESRLIESNLGVANLNETAFQDALNKLIREVKARAQDSGILLSSATSEFALDFDRFTKEVPKQTLLPSLSRQLVETEFLISLVLKHQPTEIRKFEREKAPEEDPTFKPKPLEPPPKPSTSTKKGTVREADKEAKPSTPPFQVKNYQITVVSRPESVRGILADLSSSTKPFAIVRSVTVTNEKKDGPKRKSENSLTTDAADSRQSLYIVGEEKIETSLSIEIVTFRDSLTNEKSGEPGDKKTR